MKVWVALLLAICAMSWADTVSMNFDGVEMEVFLHWFAQRSQKKIIYNHLSGLGQKKIYLIAPQPVPAESVEKVCMSLLENNGYTLIKVGRGGNEVYKLVETAKAASKPIALYSVKEIEQMEGDYYVSQLVLVRYLKAENVANSIRQAKLLDATSGNIVEIRGANALIISDFLPNVARILEIVHMIDTPPPQLETAFVALKHARADEIGQKLRELFQNKARELSQYNIETEGPTIISDSRTNSLTLRGSKEDIAEIKRLLKEYDKKIKESEVSVKIYQLKNVTPDKITPTLKEFIATPLFREKSMTATQAQQGTEISVIANEYAKCLVITAPLSAHNKLDELILKLDVRRPQVLLEAVICEFTPSDVLNLGIELTRLDKIDDAVGSTFGHGLTSFGLSSIVDEVGSPVTPENPSIPAGRTVAPGGGFTAFLTRDSKTNIPFLIKMLQSVTETEVISIPRILTDDGEKAEIRVEQEEPVTSVNALNTSTTTTSFKEFVSAGTALIITPHIVHNDSLRLEIEQNIEAFVGSSPSAGVPPPRSSRSLKTVVTVPDGETVILGGLCGRREIETVDKIPFIGDIPILGLLFQSRTMSVSKTNLYIFITPRILHHPQFDDLKDVSRKDKERLLKLKGISVDEPYRALQDGEDEPTAEEPEE